METLHACSTGKGHSQLAVYVIEGTEATLCLLCQALGAGPLKSSVWAQKHMQCR